MFGVCSEVVHCILDIVFHCTGLWRKFDHLDHSFKGLLNSKSRRRRAWLNETIPLLADLSHIESVLHFSDIQPAVDVLFVGEKNQRTAPELIISQSSFQLPLRLVQALLVGTVHNEHDSSSVLVEIRPVVAHVPLTADIPDGYSYFSPVLSGLEHFHVEADGRDGADTSVVLQFVEESRFSSVVQTQKKNLHLRFGNP